jgi:hypothetical protein
MITRALVLTLATWAAMHVAHAHEPNREKRIYQTDSVGNIQYHRPSWTVERDGRIVETNQWCEKQYHQQQYKIIDEKIVPVDMVGNPQWHKTERPGR